MPKIVRFHQTGTADVLRLEDVPLSEPGKGEVRLKVEAVGLNRAEIMFRQGQYLEAGADHVIVTDKEDVAAKTKDITGGKGATIIFDPVAGPFLEKLAAAAATRAIIFQYGALSLAPTPFPLFEAIGKGLSVRGYTLFESFQILK
jgi:NADPH:quinone reductase-like Zn-dependent oxidoreductase